MAKKQVKHNMNLVKLIQDFGSDDKCRADLEKLRWPDGPVCPRCGLTNIYRLDKRQQFECADCQYQFSVTSGTIFHDSHLPLSKWFLTIYMMIESKKGVSALQIKRELGVAYQTAWYLCHRIRAAMHEAYPYPPLKGIVEIDETFVGGKATGKGKSAAFKNKVIVVGAIQRGGKVVLKVIPARTKPNLIKFIRETTQDETEAYYTDDLPAYKGIGDYNTRHESVNHSEYEYVRGDVHTNNIEMVWQLFKRSVVGSYHQLSRKHMDAYLDELEWRFNNRENPWLFRDTVRKLIASDKLEYKKLTA